EEHVEEKARRHGVQRQLAFLEVLQDLVLLLRRELFEGLAETMVDLADRHPEDLLRRERRLVALLRRAFGVRPLAVHLRHRSPAAEELLVDEVGDAGLLRSGAELVGRDEARDRGVDERDLRGGEEHVLRGLGVARMARRFRPRDGARHYGCGSGGGDAKRADRRFQETATAFGLLHALLPGKAELDSMPWACEWGASRCAHSAGRSSRRRRG